MIKQAEEAYTWAIAYQDNAWLREEDVKSFADVDQTRIKSLFLYPLQCGSSHHVDIPEGTTPVFFRRRTLAVNPLNGQSNNWPTTHCIGWERGDTAVYLLVLQDGSTILTDDYLSSLKGIIS